MQKTYWMKFLTAFLVSSLLLGFSGTAWAQELNCTVQVNTNNIAQPDQQVFRTLQTSIEEFMNETQWTDEDYEDGERINCSLVFVVTNFENNRFQGNFQVSASRPVFNSVYTTPTFNYKDDNIDFEYIEFQPLFYNENAFTDNLTSLLSFYAYTILGMDADTFELNGGEEYHLEAQQIVGQAQGSNRAGWRGTDGINTRFRLNNDIISGTFQEYRDVMYEYHIEGIDKMAEDVKAAKKKLATIITQFKTLNARRPNSYLMRVFFDAKADEIASIYSGGPSVDIKDLVSNLQRLAPNHSSKWRSIKF